MKIVYFSFLVFLLIVPSVCAYNFTIEDQNEVCSYLNFTFVNCFEFWNIIESYNESYVCEPEIVYVNVTNVTECEKEECSELLEHKQGLWTHEENLKALEKDCPKCDDCDSECESQVLAIRRQYDDLIVDEEDSSSSIYTYLLIGLVLIVGYFVYKKFFSVPHSPYIPPYIDSPRFDKGGRGSDEKFKSSKVGEFGSR